MNTEQLAILSEPFSEDLIKQRKLSKTSDKMVTYVETHTVIRRLNEAFGGNWSFRILEHQIIEDAVLVLGALIDPDGFQHQQFGGADIQENVSLPDIFKAAASDALKKCATEMNVALDLYSDETSDKTGDTVETQSKPDAPQNGKKQYDTPMPNKIEVDCFKCPEKIAIGDGYSLPPGTWGNDTDKWQSYHKDCYQKREAAGATTPVSIPDDDEVPF